MAKQFAITGIGTDVGKTVVSAILAEAMQSIYWKPIQAGDLNNSDSKKIASLTTNVTIIPEAFKLSEPMSPHAAAKIDGIEIEMKDLHLPHVESSLIVEGAGGLMVPINETGLTFLNVFKEWNLPIIIVSKHYLGSINHSLLTAELLKMKNLQIAGFIFVGEENKNSEDIIIKSTNLPMLARIPIAGELNKKFIRIQAEVIKEKEWVT